MKNTIKFTREQSGWGWLVSVNGAIKYFIERYDVSTNIWLVCRVVDEFEAASCTIGENRYCQIDAGSFNRLSFAKTYVRELVGA